MPLTSPPDYLAVIRTLCHHRVDFVVVGGVSAVIHGAAIATLNLEIAHSRERENVERLLTALSDLEAIYRFQPERKLTPSATHLESPGHQLLLTRFGALDVLGMIGNGHEYPELALRSLCIELEGGVSVRVLDLATLIDVKKEVGAEKDLAVMKTLERLLNSQRKC